MLVRNCCCCCSQRTQFCRIAATKLGWPPQSSAKSAVGECKSKHQVTSRETELQHTHTPTLICAGRDNFKVISAVIGGGPTTASVWLPCLLVISRGERTQRKILFAGGWTFLFFTAFQSVLKPPSSNHHLTTRFFSTDAATHKQGNRLVRQTRRRQSIGSVCNANFINALVGWWHLTSNRSTNIDDGNSSDSSSNSSTLLQLQLNFFEQWIKLLWCIDCEWEAFCAFCSR